MLRPSRHVLESQINSIRTGKGRGASRGRDQSGPDETGSWRRGQVWPGLGLWPWPHQTHTMVDRELVVWTRLVSDSARPYVPLPNPHGSPWLMFWMYNGTSRETSPRRVHITDRPTRTQSEEVWQWRALPWREGPFMPLPAPVRDCRHDVMASTEVYPGMVHRVLGPHAQYHGIPVLASSRPLAST